MQAFFVSAQQNTIIFWDASWSMSQRDMIREVQYLNLYFTDHPNTKITLVVFNFDIVKEQEFHIKNGNWETLKVVLENTIYDGATSYSTLVNYSGFDDALLFTDGAQNISLNKVIKAAETLHIINGDPNINKDNLQLLAELNSGRFIDISNPKNLTPKSENISDESNKNRESILSPDQTRLEEVVVNAKVDSTNEGAAKTSYGDQEKKKLGYAVQSISDEEIGSVHTKVTTAIEGKFSGLNIDGGSTIGPQKQELSKFSVRGKGSSMLSNNYGLIVIDGVPLKRSNSFTQEIVSTDFLNPDNIADVTILKGLAATNRYGAMGNNGVLLITTKTATPGAGRNNSALAKNNTYSGKVKVRKGARMTPYLKELKANKSVSQAYDIYLNQRDTYITDPDYFLDVYDFFKPTNPELANRILSNILEKDNTGLSELKTMLYKLHRDNDAFMIYEVSKRILELYPNRAGSYLDIANAYMKINEHQKALNSLQDSYNQIKETPGLRPLKSLVRDNIKNLVYKHGAKLDTSNLDQSLKLNITYDARLTFDWSEEDAEFEVQFVNPQNKFFTWKHSDLEDPKTIQNEMDHGFNKSQFEINGNGSGKWLINVKYLGKRSGDESKSTFLKCKVQYNFGKPNQKEEIHIIRLHEKGVDEQFFELKI